MRDGLSPKSGIPVSDAIIVFGGVTHEGFENARKLSGFWTSRYQVVIWFDGFPGAKPTIPDIEELFVIAYGEQERNRRLNRFERKGVEATSIVGPGRSGDETDAGRTRMRFAGRFVAKLVKKWNTATRGYTHWRLIRREVLALADRLSPAEIVYCDDHAITAAWHAARIWPTALVKRVPTP